MTPHIMVDLETMGTRPGSVIISIGAVAFDPEGGVTGRTFYRVIEPGSCEKAGLTLDASTVKWWLTQSEEARRAVAEAGDPLAVIRAYYALGLKKAAEAA